MKIEPQVSFRSFFQICCQHFRKRRINNRHPPTSCVTVDTCVTFTNTHTSNSSFLVGIKDLGRLFTLCKSVMAYEKVGEYRVHYQKELGHGTFGTVFKAWNSSKITAAAKRMMTRDKTAFSEVTTLYHFEKNTTHDNIIGVYNVTFDKNFLWIVMEFCNLGDLNRFFNKYEDYCKFAVKIDLMKQITDGIAFLHDQNIVHRDIKPGNILLKSTAVPCGQVKVKLGDFWIVQIPGPKWCEISHE